MKKVRFEIEKVFKDANLVAEISLHIFLPQVAGVLHQIGVALLSHVLANLDRGAFFLWMKRHQPRHLMLHLSVHNLDTISIGDKN